MKRFFSFFVLAALLFLCSVPATAQSAGYDLFQTGTGTSVDLSSLGLGVVNLQGVAIQGSTGNTDTIIHRTQNVPPGGGTVAVNVYAPVYEEHQPREISGTISGRVCNHQQLRWNNLPEHFAAARRACSFPGQRH